jgi:hypothetical protein
MTPTLILLGLSSAYTPKHTPGELACGGRFTWDQYHIATRLWRQAGCGAIARVCLLDSGRCIITEVRDSGPWSAYRNGRREVQVRLKPGWRRKAVVDFSYALWVALGRPRTLSPVRVEIWPNHRPKGKGP